MTAMAQLSPELEKIKRDLTPNFARIAQKANQYVTGRIEESFAGRMSPDGTPWPGDVDLRESGDMYASFMGTGPGAINKIVVNGDRTTLHRGSDLPQASYQFYGEPKSGKKKGGGGGGGGSGRRRKKRKVLATSQYRLPPRPMIGFVDRDAQAIAEIAADDIVAGK